MDEQQKPLPSEPVEPPDQTKPAQKQEPQQQQVPAVPAQQPIEQPQMQTDTAASNTVSEQPGVQQASAENNPSQPNSPNRPKRILLVEDDIALANVYLTRLIAEGFDVRRVANGEDALASALSFSPDLILLDVMMPKVSGFDVLDILRNTPETAKIKIIMLTALSQDSDKERAESLGVDEYLVKSQVVIADVVEKIKSHLGVT